MVTVDMIWVNKVNELIKCIWWLFFLNSHSSLQWHRNYLICRNCLIFAFLCFGVFKFGTISVLLYFAVISDFFFSFKITSKVTFVSKNILQQLKYTEKGNEKSFFHLRSCEYLFWDDVTIFLKTSICTLLFIIYVFLVITLLIILFK